MSGRIHNFKILAVNLDDGVVAQSMEAAYQQLKSPGFPTLYFFNSTTFNSPAEIDQEVVNGNYWAAIYTNANISNQLTDAISSGGSVARSYNSSKAITYTWNEVRYPAFSDQIINSNLNILISATRLVFNQIYGPTAAKTIKQGDNDALQVFLNPIGSTVNNFQSTTQGPRLFFNTVSVAMMILQQFFLVLGPNMMLMAMGVYKQYSWQRTLLIRMVFAALSSFFNGLIVSGYYWAFRESWAVNGNQFVLTWMTVWLVTAIYHLFLYGTTCLVPLPAMPLILITFVFLNITSTVSPFDANPGFYRVGYATPAYQAYATLVDIWSGGRVNALYRSLPILFSWLILLTAFVVFAHRFMCLKLKKASIHAAPVDKTLEDEQA
ncbi:hypothetical protein AWJ20_3635 [Sugiyamaella lignohabitans]|uniref:DUF3533 domain-containing protein n=1 Tax=Sugiyamaella lignohabitans TaxID=796027 RepID=A0A170QYN7_9ASCO|nr:uncharacterized protein AWJ20_3635 [Sugiyamaella lignohabitans]ANB15986.1 hypothetical protein AWJ20_3635 [Sugiyamaella lignohabitans]